jgi:xylulokinase
MGAMLRIMREQMNIPVREARGTGGGAKSALWRSMQADIYQCPLTVTNSEEGGAFGAAILAGVGGGVWPGVEAACRKTIRNVQITRPNAKRAAVYARHAAVFDKLYHDLKARFAEISALSA